MRRAIVLAADWLVTLHGETPTTAAGTLFLEMAAADYGAAASGDVITRTAVGGAALKRRFAEWNLDVTASTSSVARDLGKMLERFRHYHASGSEWFEVRFLGPTAKARADKHPKKRDGDGNAYYLTVGYKRVSSSDVPIERRTLRPGRLGPAHPRIPLWHDYMSLVAPPHASFTGRVNELQEALDTFQSTDGRSVTLLIRGIPGVGKTEFARALAERLTLQFPHKHLSIDAGTEASPAEPETLLRMAIEQLEGTRVAELAHTRAELEAIYRRAVLDRRVLVVCDNVTAWSQVAALCPAAGSALIMTARANIVLQQPTNEIVLQELDHPSARALVEFLCSRTATPVSTHLFDVLRDAGVKLPSGPLKVSDVLAVLCGRLPLALRISATYLATYVDRDVQRFAEIFMNEAVRLRLLVPTETTSVEACFNISYETLSNEEQRVLRALSVFPGSFDVAAATFVAEDVLCADPSRPRTSLQELVRHGLVSYEPALCRYAIHDLVRIFTRTRQPQGQAAVFERLVRYYCEYGVTVAERLQNARVSEIGAFARSSSAELDNAAAVLIALVRDWEGWSVQRLFACSDIVRAYGVFLLSRRPLVFTICSVYAAAMMIGLHYEAVRSQIIQSDEGITYDALLIRWACHTFEACVGHEEFSRDAPGDAEVYRAYAELRSRIEDVGLTKYRFARFICMDALERMIRIRRRRDATAEEIAERACNWLTQGLGAFTSRVETLLAQLVAADALIRAGDRTSALTHMQHAMASWSGGSPPWAAALYLDALSECPSALQQARRLDVAELPGARCRSRMDEYLIARWSDFGESEDGVFAECVAYYERKDRSRRPRALVPVRAAAILLDESPEEAFRLYADFLRVAQAVGDTEALEETLVARADAYDGRGDIDAARADLETARRSSIAQTLPHGVASWRASVLGDPPRRVDPEG
jgi:hypothetical protein